MAAPVTLVTQGVVRLKDDDEDDLNPDAAPAGPTREEREREAAEAAEMALRKKFDKARRKVREPTTPLCARAAASSRP